MCELMTRMARLSSAEDFLAFFSVPFNQQVVNVARLHIMKRFGASLDSLDLAAMEEGAAMVAARAALVAAYLEFEASDGRTARLFKIFTSDPDAHEGCGGSCSPTKGPTAPVRGFVPLSALGG